MARSFNGSSDHVTAGSAPVSAAPLTLAGWVKPASVTGTNTLISLGPSADNNSRFQLRWVNTNGSAAVQAGGTTSDALTTATLSIGTWVHLCAVYASATSRSIYLNGGGKVTDVTNLTPTGINMTGIGRLERLSPGQFGNGTMAEVACWGAALSDAEVAGLASGVPAFRVLPASLLFYVPLWGIVSPEIDLVNSGMTWTVTGTAAANHAPVAPFSGLFTHNEPQFDSPGVLTPRPLRSLFVPAPATPLVNL